MKTKRCRRLFLHKELVLMHLGDLSVTFACTLELEGDFGFRPRTYLREGYCNFSRWYKKL